MLLTEHPATARLFPPHGRQPRFYCAAACCSRTRRHRVNGDRRLTSDRFGSPARASPPAPAHPRRGAADRGQHRQAARAAAEGPPLGRPASHVRKVAGRVRSRQLGHARIMPPGREGRITRPQRGSAGGKFQTRPKTPAISIVLIRESNIRDLAAVELEQVSGGCGRGNTCNCPGSSSTISNGNTTSRSCDVLIYVQWVSRRDCEVSELRFR